MPKRPTQRLTCKTCGDPAYEVGRMSWSGQCPTCGARALNENIIGLRTRSGPAWYRWRRAMAATVGGVLLEDITEREH